MPSKDKTEKIRPKILIVEDNSDDEVLLLRQSKKADLHEHVKTVRDGRQALDVLADGDGRLSAICLDLNLPKDQRPTRIKL